MIHLRSNGLRLELLHLAGDDARHDIRVLLLVEKPEPVPQHAHSVAIILINCAERLMHSAIPIKRHLQPSRGVVEVRISERVVRMAGELQRLGMSARFCVSICNFVLVKQVN